MRRRYSSLIVGLTVTTGLLFAPTAQAFDVETASFLLSVKSTTELDRIGGGEVTVQNEDVVFFQVGAGDAGAYELFIDGSDVGIDGAIDAFTIWPEGSAEGEDMYLMSFAADEELDIVGPDNDEVDDSDIVAFLPDEGGLGRSTSGVFFLIVSGEEIGLTTSGEDIDAIEFELEDDANSGTPHLYFSTTGNFTVPNPPPFAPPSSVSGSDEDIVHCHLVSADSDDDGQNVCADLQIEFDGTNNNFEEAEEDIDALGFDGEGGVQGSTTGDFDTPTQAGPDEDVFTCFFAGGECEGPTQDIDLWWTGDNNGITGDVGAIHTQCVEIPFDFQEGVEVNCPGII